MMDITKQEEELEVLKSIYGPEWKEVSSNCYNIDIIHDKITVSLYFTLPNDYPSTSPPVCELSAPMLNKLQKDTMNSALNELYLENIGETVLYQWVEKVRDLVQQFSDNNKKDDPAPFIDKINETLDIHVEEQICPEIVHGPTIEDRKSTFQGHAAIIYKPQDVNLVLQTLLKERKIAEATHNILAWRCGTSQDFDDDGEKAAGGRLLHLLEILNVNNIVVIVSRWYGGIHLGSARFRHINNAARQALLQYGVISS